ncbi:MAG TPA: peroxiredoxin-like family protein [Rhodanobacteraceae bacterium]|nr:peroxiredoxin-like family protein [Rhodanobacteraceae bacterium]
MRLKSPTLAPRLTLEDVNGKPVTLGGSGRRTMLCFFRDAACPFCNFRIYELTYRQQQLATLGIDVIALFSSTPEELKRFVTSKPRPFPVIADTASVAYSRYGIERSLLRKWTGILTRIPTLLKGLRIVGLAGLRTNDLLPADFLIDENGHIVEAWYGRDAGDRIPFEHIELFGARGLLTSLAPAD